MSGGFFRGTSADQDTRFSNKQAKLLKSQKFAPELENLVDMSKVNMDVMRPWIAKRVTELIGVEDEVLINFIYGLLEGKAVNGKEVQISLTGFMERNTGKFMKELWALLLSAQQNVSGIPQHFLDAKEEETRKKKAENDRIANEIHKNKVKEKLEFEQEKTKMGGEDSRSRDEYAERGVEVKHDTRESNIPQEDDIERIQKNDRKGHRGSRSPDSTYHSRSPRRKHSSSPSKSSNSRSPSNERGRSRSTSGGPPSRSRSISMERKRRPGRERSMTPIRMRNVRRSPSPRPASLHSKRRSTSHSRYRSPSPAHRRVRSPMRRRSRSPMRRQSRSPIRRRSRSHIRRRSRTPIRRSPLRYRSRTPLRRRSPSPMRRRRRSPSPRRHRSPSPRRHRSPSPRRRRSPSPIRRRSPSPTRRRSPSPTRRRSPSPVRRRSRSPARRKSPSPVRRRSPSPMRKSRSPVRRKSSFVSGKSPSPVYHSSSSPRRRRLASPARRSSPPLRHQPSPTRRQYKHSPSTSREQSMSPARGRPTMHDRKRSTPVRQTSTREESGSPLDARHGSLSPIDRGPIRRSMRSPIQSPRGRTRRHDNYSPARRTSPGEVELPVENRKGARSAGSKPSVSLRSPQRDTLDQDDLHEKDRDLLSSMQKSPSASHFSRSDSDEQSEKVHDRMNKKEPDVSKESSRTHKTTGLGIKGRETYTDDDGGARGKGKNTNRVDDSKGSHQLSQLETPQKLSRNPERNDQNGSWNSPSKDADEGRVKVKGKRKHKKSDSQELESDDDSSYDSYEERKEAKRRRREEKKMKKEKRRRRREEKRRKREERRAEKVKSKSGDSDSSSSEDLGRRHPDDDSGRLRDSRASKTQETEFDQKKLEIELREKALETLRAKKGLGS